MSIHWVVSNKYLHYLLSISLLQFALMFILTFLLVSKCFILKSLSPYFLPASCCPCLAWCSSALLVTLDEGWWKDAMRMRTSGGGCTAELQQLRSSRRDTTGDRQTKHCSYLQNKTVKSVDKITAHKWLSITVKQTKENIGFTSL